MKELFIWMSAHPGIRVSIDGNFHGGTFGAYIEIRMTCLDTYATRKSFIYLKDMAMIKDDVGYTSSILDSMYYDLIEFKKDEYRKKLKELMNSEENKNEH